MSRTLAGGLATHLAGTAHTRCRMLLFVLRDGTKYGVTDHNKDIEFTLPEDGDEITYSSASGFRTSDIEIPTNLDPGNYEVSGPVGDVVTLEQLLGGRWRRAVTYLFEVNWKSPLAAIDLMKGTVTKAGPVGGEFRFEIRDDRDKLTQSIGRTITNQCRRVRSDCCVNIAPETETTVASVTSALEFTVAATITSEDFINGRLWFTDGELSGNDPADIFTVTGSTIVLQEPLPTAPQVGDAVTLKEGCDGSIQMCRDRFDNAISHDGFSTVPGNKALLPALPGQGSDGIE